MISRQVTSGVNAQRPAPTFPQNIEDRGSKIESSRVRGASIFNLLSSISNLSARMKIILCFIFSLRFRLASRRIAFTIPLTHLSTICILSPALASRRPGGKLSNNNISKTIKIFLERYEEAKCVVW
jgi:hypothetical protein